MVWIDGKWMVCTCVNVLSKGSQTVVPLITYLFHMLPEQYEEWKRYMKASYPYQNGELHYSAEKNRMLVLLADTSVKQLYDEVYYRNGHWSSDDYRKYIMAVLEYGKLYKEAHDGKVSDIEPTDKVTCWSPESYHACKEDADRELSDKKSYLMGVIAKNREQAEAKSEHDRSLETFMYEVNRMDKE